MPVASRGASSPLGFQKFRRSLARPVNAPQLGEVLRYLWKGDQLIVTSMDRLARSLVDLHTIAEDLVGRAVSVRFLREGQTYSAKADPIAKLMLGLMGSVAGFERSILKERQAEGIARAKARSITRVGRRCSPTLRSFKHDSG